jgi:hypothetical protein
LFSFGSHILRSKCSYGMFPFGSHILKNVQHVFVVFSFHPTYF